MASTPRNIVPLLTPELHAAFAAAPSSARLSYHGGPLLTNVQVQAIFWGAAWQLPAQSPLIPKLGQFFSFILESSLVDVLGQYSVPGHTIAHGRYLGAVTVTAPAPSATVTDVQVQQALRGWIQTRTVAQTNPNTLYFVFLPPGVVSTQGGQTSCAQYCGYHKTAGNSIYYAVVPFLNCAGCVAGSGIFDSLTKVSSHELCEAITNPAANAWFDDATGNEIGDICNKGIATLGGFVIQSEWSNSQGACVIAPVLTRFKTRVLETATTFKSEPDGVWMMADYDRDGVPDLVFVKTSNTTSGKVEVHIASGASKYQTRILETVTSFKTETDGAWLMADYNRDGVPDLVFVKTSNTAGGKVEVHIASGASKYQSRILETATSFKPEADGVWMMADYDRDGIPDLIFVKTSKAPSGKVEIHIASGASKYQTRILETATTFKPEADGVWLMADYDRDGVPDLVFLKTSNTGSDKIEVHIASGASKYQTRILETPTTFKPEADGVWLMADYNRDGVPDLVFVKTTTPTGKVEVHIASGA